MHRRGALGGAHVMPRDGQRQIPAAGAVGGPERPDTTRRVLPGGSTVTPRQGQRQIPIAGAIGGPKQTDMETRKCGAPGGALGTPTQGKGEIPVVRATGGPRQTWTTVRRRGAPGGAPGMPDTKIDEDDLEEGAPDTTDPEGLLTGNEFLRLAGRREIDEDNHCFVVFVREADPEDGYQPAHPRGRRLYTDVEGLFPEELPDGVPAGGRPEHAIPLKEDAKPMSRAMYRLSPKERDECRAFMAKAMKKGWIRPSCSPWGAPVLFVAKKGGDLWFCVDYRWLNKQTVRDEYPLPMMGDLLDWSHGKKVFTSLYLHSG